jgi:hypothetical protein
MFQISYQPHHLKKMGLKEEEVGEEEQEFGEVEEEGEE